MGVYIPNMEMPKEFDIDVYIEFACGIEGKRYARLYNSHLGGLTEWCEAVPAPPHGRLIEKNAVFELIRSFPNVDRQLPVEFMKALYELPTILEAEEGE